MRHKRKQAEGFTLIEILVALAIFVILIGSVMATFTIAMGYWRSGNAQNDAKEGARFALQTIEAELSQAIIDPDPGTINPPTGYFSIIPALSGLLPPYNAPTGVLLPNGNAAQQTSQTLIFNEPNTTHYNPFNVGWNPDTPDNYRQVQYSVVNGDTLQRSETDYDSTGSVTSQQTNPVVEITNGTLSLQVTYTNAYSFQLQIVSQKNGNSYPLFSQLFIPGGESQ